MAASMASLARLVPEWNAAPSPKGGLSRDDLFGLIYKHHGARCVLAVGFDRSSHAVVYLKVKGRPKVDACWMTRDGPREMNPFAATAFALVLDEPGPDLSVSARFAAPGVVPEGREFALRPNEHGGWSMCGALSGETCAIAHVQVDCDAEGAVQRVCATGYRDDASEVTELFKELKEA